MRPKHPNKEIEATLQEAEADGRIVIKRSGDAWGIMRCASGERGGCQASIWSTPRDPDTHAKQLRRAAIRCLH